MSVLIFSDCSTRDKSESNLTVLIVPTPLNTKSNHSEHLKVCLLLLLSKALCPRKHKLYQHNGGSLPAIKNWTFVGVGKKELLIKMLIQQLKKKETDWSWSCVQQPSGHGMAWRQSLGAASSSFPVNPLFSQSCFNVSFEMSPWALETTKNSTKMMMNHIKLVQYDLSLKREFYHCFLNMPKCFFINQ